MGLSLTREAQSTGRNYCYESAEERQFNEALIKAVKCENFEQLDLVLTTSEVDPTHTDHCCVIAIREAARNGHLVLIDHLISGIHNEFLRSLCCKEAADTAHQRKLIPSGFVNAILPKIANDDFKNHLCLLGAESANSAARFEEASQIVEAISCQSLRTACCRSASSLANTNKLLDSYNAERHLNRISHNELRNHCCAQASVAAAKRGELEVASRVVASMESSHLRDESLLKVIKCAADKDRLDIAGPLLQIVDDSFMRSYSCHQVTKIYLRLHRNDDTKSLLDSISTANLTDDCWVLAIEAAVKDNDIPAAEFLLKVISDAEIKGLCSHYVFMAALRVNQAGLLNEIDFDIEWALRDDSVLKYLSDKLVEGGSETLSSFLRRAVEPDQIAQLHFQSIRAGHLQLAIATAPHLSDVNATDSTGSSALMLAADDGHDSLIWQLLSLGASVQAVDRRGRTALSRACAAGRLTTARMLVEQGGSDPFHRDDLELTCLQLARKNGHHNLVEELE